ncbi:MAG: DUF4430 domain-containing protein [Lachnospiraceae bacterium]|nr:DUF4430 domain-containing protein [Lachnospiraceae bacterium]
MKGEKKMKKSLKIVLGVTGVVALVAALVAVWMIFGAKPQAGAKEITIEVINSADESTVYELNTDAEYLRQAMDEAEGLTYDGTEGEYGIMISTVNGEVADYNVDGSYWSFYVNGEYCNYGIDTQPVADGDAFVIEYAQ